MMCTCFARIQPVAAWFQLILALLCDSPHLVVINWVQFCAVGGHSSREMKSGVLRCIHQLNCIAPCAGALCAERPNCHPRVFDNSRHLLRYNTAHWLFTPDSTKNTHCWHSDRRQDRLGIRQVWGNRRQLSNMFPPYRLSFRLQRRQRLSNIWRDELT